MNIRRITTVVRHVARFGMIAFRELRQEEPRRVSEILSNLESAKSLDDLDRAIAKAKAAAEQDGPQ